MKTYTFKLVIKEGCDEFWEGIKGTGCDEVLKGVKIGIEEIGFIHSEVTLQKFEDEP